MATMPGQSAPDGAIVVGSQYTQDITEANVRQIATGSFAGQFNNLGIDWKAFLNGILQQIGEVVQDLIQALVDGATTVGGVVVGTINNLVDGFVNLVQNVAGAVLGGGTRAQEAGLPETFAPGALRDIADSQRRYMDLLEALEDNAGHCSVTPERNWNVPSTSPAYFRVPYDTQMSAQKNARPLGSRISGIVGTELDNQIFPGILLEAPGVWTIATKLTINPPGGAQTFDMDVSVTEVKQDPTTGYYTYGPDFSSESRSTWASTNGEWITAVENKSVVIPDNIGEPDQYGSGLIIAGYHVAVRCRRLTGTNGAWQFVGGTMRSQLSVERLSTDTTNYSPPEESTSTGNL